MLKVLIFSILVIPIWAHKHVPSCNGGGLRVEGNSYSIRHLLSENLERISCSPKHYSQEHEKRFIDQKNKIYALVEKIKSKEKECPTFLNKIMDDFLKSKKEDEDANTFVFDHLREIKDSGEMEFAHAQTQEWAMIATFCTTSKATADIKTFWKYYEKLNILSSVKAQEAKQGETINDCRNVKASGNDDLSEFYIDLANADTNEMTLEYSMAGIPDQIQLFNQKGKKIFDSGCVSGTKTQKLTISTDRFQEEKLKVNIIAKCEGDESTYWGFRFACQGKNKNKLNAGKCSNDALQLNDEILKALKMTDKLLDSFWSQALCYNNLYDKTMKQFSKYGKFVKEVVDMDCKKQSSPNCLKGEVKAPELEVKNFKAKIGNQFQPPRNLKSGKIGYEEKECDRLYKKPDTIFKKVSKAYCMYGFERLFGED
tara:strand:- start:114326 stop:115603 length:1278 start_codon:yes stop_codon:yes gene_type:complete